MNLYESEGRFSVSRFGHREATTGRSWRGAFPTQGGEWGTTSRRSHAHHAVAMNANVLNADLAGWCGKE
jgi:hypothetical protein